MGCNSSSNSVKRGDSKEISNFLTTEEIKIVHESWALVALDLPALGLYVFTRLFEMDKDFKKLFRRLMTQDESGTLTFDSMKLERHATNVMKHFGMAVDILDDAAYFTELFTSLGERHRDYNVKPEMFPFLWPAIRDGLKMRLGDKFTIEGELAWKHLFDYIISKMTYGFENGRIMNNQAQVIKKQ